MTSIYACCPISIGRLLLRDPRDLVLESVSAVSLMEASLWGPRESMPLVKQWPVNGIAAAIYSVSCHSMGYSLSSTGPSPSRRCLWTVVLFAVETAELLANMIDTRGSTGMLSAGSLSVRGRDGGGSSACSQ